MLARLQKWFAKRAEADRKRRYNDGAAYALHALFFSSDRPAEARKLEAYTLCSKDFGFADVFDDGIRDVVTAYNTGSMFPNTLADDVVRVYDRLVSATGHTGLFAR